jgi:pimeloyl-ACP methyl ester carboxylesterase
MSSAEPRVRYATTDDGVKIAYWTIGQGPVLLMTPYHGYSHIGLDWQHPVNRAIYDRLASGCTLVRFDGRGTGLSQRDAVGVSIEDRTRDIAAVDAAISDGPMAVLALGYWGGAAIRFAVENPDIVRQLIIYDSFISGSEIASQPLQVAVDATIEALSKHDLVHTGRVMATMLGADPDWWAAYWKAAITSDTLAQIKPVLANDCSPWVSRVPCPCLVIQEQWPDDDSQFSARLAAALPNAELVSIKRTHQDPWWDVADISSLVYEFLGLPAPLEDEVAVGSGASGEDVTIAVSAPGSETFARGRYVVRRLLGEGGQKTAYLVHDEVLGRDCALSLLRGAAFQDESLERFRREARAMAGIGTHANIVAVFDFGDEEGRPFLVCEYVPGGDLRTELVKASGPLSLARALSITSDIATGLAAAHQRGVIHRDLKPENVWLSDKGRAKLGDFGLALVKDQLTLTVEGAMMGTPAYMSPEQSVGGEVDARSDLYSLGAMLYEMTTGRPPFVGKDALSIISQHVNGTPEPPSHHNSAISADLDALILGLLAKSPAARAANALDVVAELIGISGRTS